MQGEGGRCKERMLPKQNKWCALLYLQDVDVGPNGNVYPHGGVGFAELQHVRGCRTVAQSETYVAQLLRKAAIISFVPEHDFDACALRVDDSERGKVALLKEFIEGFRCFVLLVGLQMPAPNMAWVAVVKVLRCTYATQTVAAEGRCCELLACLLQLILQQFYCC